MKTKEILQKADFKKAPEGMTSTIMQRIKSEERTKIDTQSIQLVTNRQKWLIVFVIFCILGFTAWVAQNTQNQPFRETERFFKDASLYFTGYGFDDLVFPIYSIPVLLLIGIICYFGIDLIFHKNFGRRRLVQLD